MKTKLIKDNLEGFTGHAALYELDEEIDYGDGKTKHVVVSATVAMFGGPETYIFPANEDGEIVDYGELPGSYKGGLDHETALADFA